MNAASMGMLRSAFAASLSLLFLSGCDKINPLKFGPNDREFAYITNSGSGTVTVLDVVNLRIDRELQVGVNPVAVAASPSRNEVYVVNAGATGANGSLAIIDATRNIVAGSIALHRSPRSIELDAAGAFAYITNSASNTVSIVDLKAHREIAQVGTGERPIAARLTPDGNTLIVANEQGDAASVIDVASRRVRAVFGNCPGASDVAILPDSSKAFVACSGGHQVMVIALGGGKENSGRQDQLEAMLDVGRAPAHLALKPDGGEVFVSNSMSDSISEIDTSKSDVGGAYMIGDGPVRGLVSSDNAYLYVANARSQYVTVYSIDDGKRVPGPPGTLHVGDGPQALAFAASGRLLLVVDNRSSDVAVLRTDATARSLLSIFPTGRNPSAIAVKPFQAK